MIAELNLPSRQSCSRLSTSTPHTPPPPLYCKQETSAQTRSRNFWKLSALVSAGTRTVTVWRQSSLSSTPYSCWSSPDLVRKELGDQGSCFLDSALSTPIALLESGGQDRQRHACWDADSGHCPRGYASEGMRITLGVSVYTLHTHLGCVICQAVKTMITEDKQEWWSTISCQYPVPHLIIMMSQCYVTQHVLLACTAGGILNDSK